MAPWRDRLQWVQSPDFPLELNDEIPVVSFSEDCYYRKAASRALKKQRRKLNVVFESRAVDKTLLFLSPAVDNMVRP